MVRMIRSCLQSILKLLNSLIAMAGIAMLLYSGWMIIAWKRETGALPSWDDHHQVPWFIYTFLSLGIVFCVITCCGHVAAETANGCCLYLYMLFIFMLIILEAGVTVDVFLNHDWEKDFPKDPSMNFEQFKNFIRSNFEICKWVGLIIVSTQGFCLLLAMVLKAVGPHQYYDSDDEYASNERVPLLKNAPPSYAVGGPFCGSRSDAWNIRINDKANR